MSMPKHPDPFSLVAEKSASRDYLLELVKKDAMRNLENEIIEGIRPRVREQVEKAFLELQPHLEAIFNPMSRELAIRLTVKEVP